MKADHMSIAVRKLRLQAQEHTRERDLANAEVRRLEEELAAARDEVTSVRNSTISEKRSLEDRLSEERKAKERTRAQLEERLEAAQQKQSKFRVSCTQTVVVTRSI
jgi:chromosome segregation ATPase